MFNQSNPIIPAGSVVIYVSKSPFIVNQQPVRYRYAFKRPDGHIQLGGCMAYSIHGAAEAVKVLHFHYNSKIIHTQDFKEFLRYVR